MKQPYTQMFDKKKKSGLIYFNQKQNENPN